MDISTLISDNGLSMTISIIAIMTVVYAVRTIAKYTPIAAKAVKEIIEVWKDFVNAMQTNAIAIDKNTEITDKNHRHSEIVLRELEKVNNKFNAHDDNALEIRKKIDEVVELLGKNNNSDEVIELLQSIIKKLE